MANEIDHIDRIWAAIRNAGSRWTRAEIARASKEDLTRVRSYLSALQASGHIERLPPPNSGGGVQKAFFKCLKDIAIAPRLKPDGTPDTSYLVRVNVWRSLRMGSTFTARELATLASVGGVEVKDKTVSRYLDGLRRAGLVRHHKGETPAYSIKVNTGPRAPVFRSVAEVYDPNRGEVIWRADEGSRS